MEALDPLERDYLETRYSCEALRILLRRGGMRETAARLSTAMRQLCAELRAHLARQGKGRVSSTFDPNLLKAPIEELLERCRASARKLQGRGSRAAKIILESLSTLEARQA